MHTFVWYNVYLKFKLDKMKKSLLSLLLLIFFLKINAQDFSWVAHSDSELYSGDMTTDAAGNVYIVGSFTGTVDFDPTSGTQNYTAQGYSDIYIQKLDINGNLIWLKQIGATTSHSFSFSFSF